MAVYGSTQTNRASLMQQLQAHSNWKGGKEEKLEPGTYVIVKKDDSNFCLVWLNGQGEKFSVPFEITDKDYLFKNGQWHHSYQLDEVIAEIFKHYV
jgi:hypothetical protein